MALIARSYPFSDLTLHRRHWLNCRMSLLRLCVACLLLLITLPRISSADDVTAAKLHYERGTTLYDLQRYLEAAKEYEAAFEAKNDPALLFNIAQSYRFGGDYAKAIAAFRSYLRRQPSADNREEVTLRISELQRLIDAQKANQQKPPTGTIRPGNEPQPEIEKSAPRAEEAAAAPPVAEPAAAVTPDRPGRTKLIAGIAVGAVGIVAIAVGAAFEALAKSQNDSLTSPAPGTVFDPKKEQTLKTDEGVGAAMLGVGGAALVAGTVVAILGLRERRAHAVALTPVLSTHRFGLVLDASF